jgi:hypothetical protein
MTIISGQLRQDEKSLCGRCVQVFASIYTSINPKPHFTCAAKNFGWLGGKQAADRAGHSEKACVLFKKYVVSLGSI